MKEDNKEENWLSRNFTSVLACTISLTALVLVYFRVDMVCSTDSVLSSVIAIVAVIVALQALFQIYNAINYRRDIDRAYKGMTDMQKSAKRLEKDIKDLKEVTNDIIPGWVNDAVSLPLEEEIKKIKEQLNKYKTEIEQKLEQKTNKEIKRIQLDWEGFQKTYEKSLTDLKETLGNINSGNK